MSVVVWDGVGLAADRQATSYEMSIQTQKLFRGFDGSVLGFTGEVSQGLELVEWYNNGHIAEQYPEFQKTDDWTRLIVCKVGECFYYEKSHIPLKVYDKYAAFGSGRDFAIGSLAMGGNSVIAVSVANQFNIYCGYGVDYLEPTDNKAH